ncbi:MAG: hypothetical protein IIZ29_00750 [Schwartzia sp.]|nr:hypothetical protein [Schwartzia sp. (in: firmicutes)]
MQESALRELFKAAFTPGSPTDTQAVSNALAALFVHNKYANAAAAKNANAFAKKQFPSTEKALKNEIAEVCSSEAFQNAVKGMTRERLQQIAAASDATLQFCEECSATAKKKPVKTK